MTSTIIVILLIIGIIYLVSIFGEKKPSTNEEIRADIYNQISKIETEYVFDQPEYFQTIDNIKVGGWYVADCGEYFRIIVFQNDNQIKISTASKEMLKQWDYAAYMRDVNKRLNDGFLIKTKKDKIKNQIELTFPENDDKAILFECKLKLNGVLVVRRHFTDKLKKIRSFVEEQYLHQRENSLGYDIGLNRFVVN